MKMIYIFIAALAVAFICLCFYLNSMPSKKESELIVIKNDQLFIYKSGTAINFRLIEKFKVYNPSPCEYGVRATIGWSSYVIKSGFKKREDAEEWLESFLKNPEIQK